MCGQSGTPISVCSCYIDNKRSSPNLFCVFLCPNCEKLFIGNYHYYDCDSTTLLSLEPQHIIEEKDFSKNIKKISPTFCDIYNQAFASQQYNLNDISGMGYRKALEFLVKDYAVYLHPNDKDKIIKSPISRCINDYIENKKIKELAIASTWLGNDETHYERKQAKY